MRIEEKISLLREEAMNGNEEIIEFMNQVASYPALARMINRPQMQASIEEVEFYNRKLEDFIFDREMRKKLSIN